ncbi:MAG: NADH-quinone oxidoreductase subunit J [Coriobacteriia bacterium]|nr:NADH-quinone oxidoreductase subunit J [Coriobacteriia bacterium]
MSSTIAFWAVIVLLTSGALGVVLSREAMRLTLSFGVFLLGVAASFLYFGLAFLAVAQLFVYVGGVLILVLFALMMVRRGDGDKLLMEVRWDWAAAVTASAVTVLIVTVLAPEFTTTVPAPGAADSGAMASVLLEHYLPAFEIAGALLLVAVLAVLVIVGRGDER